MAASIMAVTADPATLHHRAPFHQMRPPIPRGPAPQIQGGPKFVPPTKVQPPWEELIRQQAELGQLQRQLHQARLAAAAAVAAVSKSGATGPPALATANAQLSAQQMRMLQQPRPPSSTKTNMAAHLLCLTAGGGVPLFTRRKGELKALPFPVVGSLNGVHMFARTRDVQLLSTLAPGARIVWKTYHDSIMLILATASSSDDGMATNLPHDLLLDAVFDTMVLLIGLDDLTRIKNVERLKRDLRCCYRLIDSLLDQADAECCLFGPMTRTVDCILTSHQQALQNYLEAFVESTDSTYGCLLLKGRLLVSTRKWATLTVRESSLVAAFICSCPRATMRDMPVFLPVESPTVPHRLLTFALLPHIEVCVLCGPTPTVAQLEKEVLRYWRNAYEPLRSVGEQFPRCFPPSVVLDKNLYGFLLIDTDTRRSLCSVQPTDDSRTDTKQPSIRRRQEVLYAFYNMVVGGFFATKLRKSSSVEDDHIVYHTRLKHEALETYTCSEHHKAYAIWSKQYQLFTVFNTTIPTYVLRSVSQEILQRLTKDKHVHF